jgi:RNA polymerase sigma-70 factor (ECF subfamily)
VPPGTPYASSPEPLVVHLAGRGDRLAFEELVRRRQSWVRNLMRRLSRDASLADDLAQQAFIQVWRTIGQLQHPERFPGWLKRLAVNVWLQHRRRDDVLASSETIDDHEEPIDAGMDARGRATQGAVAEHTTGVALDVDQALALLPSAVRLCVVLSYHAEMSHAEIAETTSLPLGTVKSHRRRGTERLESLLSAYSEGATRGVAL